MVTDASVRRAQANQQWFLCVFCTCLSMLLPNKLYFRNSGRAQFKTVSDYLCIRRHRRLLPSNNWALLSFKLCASWKKLLHPNYQLAIRVFAYLESQHSWDETSQDLPFPPQMGGRSFFVYSHSKPAFFISDATIALTKKGKRHFKTWHKSYERDFHAKTPLHATKFRNHSLQHEGA